MTRTSGLLALAGATLVGAQGYSSECSDITFSNNWLIATCPTGSGEEITSSVYLPGKIGNNDGALEWATGTGAYHQTCEDCALSDSATLSCRCQISSFPSLRDTTLNLEEHIANYEGHLLSNQTGAITTIPANSAIPVPSDFGVIVQLAGTNNSCASFGGTLGYDLLTDCFWLNLGVDVSWPTASHTNNQGWEISGFTDQECAGTAAATFTQENEGECFEFGPGLKAFSWKPLWNADY
ncbi:Cyanovirin-N [Aspergillus heterothallicus]